MIHCPKCGEVPVPEEDLPVELPRDVEITGMGGSALSKIESWRQTTCPRCGAAARRETDTMDTFVDSSWYFYRYLDPGNDRAPFDAEKARAWFPIDLYIGGVEHAILHLIYCRFWTKMMRDLGLASTDEPVIRQLSQGMVIKDGAKMSKSKGNIVDPDAVVERHGADAIRLYVLFESPPEKEMDWTDARLSGPARFLRRLERMIPGDADWLPGTPLPAGDEEFAPEDVALRRKTHQTIRRVTRDLAERIHPNTAIAAIMELTSAFSHRLPEAASEASRRAVREAVEAVVSLLNPMAPHLTEELWERLDGETMLVETPWPQCDDDLAREEQVLVVLQVNGKLRGRLEAPAGLEREALVSQARENAGVRRHLEGLEVRRVVTVPDRLVNFVASHPS
jgi:leucyl-tRNA synthetase